jgi:hypothetical protein
MSASGESPHTVPIEEVMQAVGTVVFEIVNDREISARMAAVTGARIGFRRTPRALRTLKGERLDAGNQIVKVFDGASGVKSAAGCYILGSHSDHLLSRWFAMVRAGLDAARIRLARFSTT